MSEGPSTSHLDKLGKVGAALALAMRGATEHEREAGLATAQRLMAKLSPEETRMVMRCLPGNGEKAKQPPRVRRRRTGTKRELIVERLREGRSPKSIANELGVRVQYVYNVRREML